MHVAEAALEDRLIDIAYVERVSPEEIQIVLDPAMPFDYAKDFDWLKSVIETVLADAGQAGITIEAIAPSR
ncbi:MAG TPA: hypothetical protein VFW44_17185 [Bryobacteraceae bacterium]|nr:hypothetical protein [Bryobacteraceae bacterium]